jgi:hypothetical protein
MSSINSYADIFRDWEGLNEAALRNPEVQQSIEPERLSLLESLAEIQSLKGRQDELTALRQEVTQNLKAAIVKGKEVAIRVRSVVRGKIGPRSERLVHFKVAPIRKRTRKPVAAVKPAAVEPPAAEPAG